MDCPKCGGDMWDNREKKKNPKAPDFKCKDKDCYGVIWPPRGAKSTTAPQSHATGRTSTGNGGKEGYWERKEQRDLEQQPRIERQHSQEMALRYFAQADKLPTTQQLTDMISWFQRDIGRSPEKQDKPERPPHTAEDDTDIPF